MKKKNIKLGSFKLTNNSGPYIIAEIGVNHECSIKLAKKMIDQASSGGAQAVKFQTYKAEKIAAKKSPFYWDLSEEKTKSQYELFKKYDQFEFKDYLLLQKYCKKKGIDFLSTPFDEDAVDKLNNLVPFFKIASADLNNFPLLEKIAKKKKAVLLSTGASNIKEIRESTNFLKKKGCTKIVLLHCILSYPTKYENANLRMISDLIKEFPNNIIGYSDHTKPDKDMSSVISAYLLGAQVIEKHFTFNKKLKGNDHYHSMDFKDLKNLTSKIKFVKKLLGNIDSKKCIDVEKISRKNARRSIYVKKTIKKGSKIRRNDLICKRPALGLPPKNLFNIVGKRARKEIKVEKLISKEDFY